MTALNSSPLGDPSFALSESDRLARILTALPDAILVLDRNWHVTFANQSALRIAQLTPPQLQTNFWDAQPHLLGTELEHQLRRAMQNAQPGELQFLYQPSQSWMDIRIIPTDEGIVLNFRDITAERENQQILVKQQELLTTVQQAGKAATWELSLETGKLTYGPGFFPVFGNPTSAISSYADLIAILQQEHRDHFVRVLADARSNGKMFRHEFAVTAADGTSVWVESRGQWHTSTSTLRGIFLDTTETKQRQASLIASEERYRVLADLNPQAIWMGDAAGNVTYANQGLLQYTGLNPESLAERWLDAFAPEDRERVLNVWGNSVSTGVNYDVEAMLREASTQIYRYWHIRALPVRNEEGEILHWLGAAQDIHDAKNSAAALRAQQLETERRNLELEIIYKSTPVGLALFDPVDFRFLNLNDTEAAMLGRPKDEILGRTLEELAPDHSVPGLLDLLRSAAQGTVIKDRLLEGELPSSPGEPRAWRVSYSPVFDEDGTVRAISTAAIEITDQKRAESALIQSEKLAAVGRLASSISHEINNPLEAITNLLYLIANDDSLSSDLKHYVHTAQSEISRVSQIATQTLRFHRQSVAPTSVSAEDLLGPVIRLYTGRLGNSSIRVQTRYSSATRVLCFENDIRQVLNNLIANSIDAMRNGGRLVVRAHDCVTAPEGGLPARRPGVRIAIADTGHGMSTNVLKRIFEPFYTTKSLNGTGLGLWISAGIVERHQGRLQVRSSEHPIHHGTIFNLFLPCKETPIP